MRTSNQCPTPRPRQIGCHDPCTDLRIPEVSTSRDCLGDISGDISEVFPGAVPGDGRIPLASERSTPLVVLNTNEPSIDHLHSGSSGSIMESIEAFLTRQVTAIQSLYIHVPFCFHKCHYCDFYSLAPTSHSSDGLGAIQAKLTMTHESSLPVGAVVDDPRYGPFLDRLVEEIELRVGQCSLSPKTLFIGGGTPTLLPRSMWVTLLETLRTQNVLVRCHEFTVEANPETVNTELFQLLADGGVNRISIGAQSFQPQLLKALERWHEPAKVVRAVDLARGAGIENVNLDLIFAIPGQTLAMVEADLDAALALEPDHLSCYNLTYEPNTAMTQRLKQGQVQPIDEALEAAMYSLILDKLAAGGFEHYEVSSWARRFGDKDSVDDVIPKAWRCNHNLVYWHNKNWLGMGPSAASHMNGRRWKNQPHLGRYLSNQPHPPVIDDEQLTADQQVGETFMLGLRLLEGIHSEWVHAHVQPDDTRGQAISRMVDLGLLEWTHTHLRLTRRGLFVADTVLAELL